MKEYIERAAVLNLLEKINPVDFGSIFDYKAHGAVGECLREICYGVENIPATDVVPVVRCRECRYSSLPSGFTQRYGEPGTLSCHFGPCNRRNVNVNDFCSYGQRKIETVLPINCTKDEGLEDEHEVS